MTVRRAPLLLAVMLCACVVGRYTEGDEVRWAQLAAIRPGETTKTEVLQRLGAPDSLATPTMIEDFLENQGLEPEVTPELALEDVFTYQFTRGELRGMFTLFYNRVNMTIKSDLIVIIFEDDLVTHVGYRRSTDDASTEGEEDAR